MKIYDADTVAEMMPLLHSYSRSIEKLYLEVEEITNNINELESLEDAQSHAGEIEVQEHHFRLKSRRLIDTADELKKDFGIGVCNPVFGTLDVGIMSKSGSMHLMLCVDYTCTADPDTWLCHETYMGSKQPRLSKWSDV